MKMLYNIFFAGLCVLGAARMEATNPALTKASLQQAFKKLDLEIPIRVLLDEKATQEEVLWKMGSRGGFLVFSPATKQKTVYQLVTLTATCKDGSFYINGTKQNSDHLFIIPLASTILFEKNIYDGVLALSLYQGTAYLVNHVDLEDYVLSVLPYESHASWPDEVHKAFCIAFRSYGIAKVLQQRALHAQKGLAVPFDIKNTNVHQIYKGRSNSARFKKIIDQTRGVVLAHKGKPVLAMFDICCGDIVPADKDGIHFSKAPHLKRTYPCTFCKEYKFYTWTCTYSFEEIENALKKEMPDIGNIQDIKIASVDKAAVVQEVKIRTKNRWVTLTAAKLKSCLREMKSLAFTLQKTGLSLKITGKGHGHHMGLCQRGAYYMVLKGWSYRNILKFYYPHTMFMKLKKINY